MIRTHLAVSILAILLFLPRVSSPFIFVFVALFATFLPDVDIPFSTAGRKKSSRFIQEFTEHRGFFHSITIAVILSFVIGLFFPVASFPFFLGYSLHVFADSFTKKGIKPFWPYKRKVSGGFKTGGYGETLLFIFLAISILITFVFSFKSFL